MKINIIYIILGLIWVLYKMYKKAGDSKPNSAKPFPQPQSENPNPGDVKSLFDDFMKGEEVKKILNVPVERKIEPTKTKTPHKTKPESFLPGDTTIASIKHSSPVYSVEPAFHPDYLASFNLKQAIIFSEIINRPYN